MDRKESPHPMVDVPLAVRTVLRETATQLLSLPNEEQVEEFPAVCRLQHIYGRVLARDVVMREPGYPPYRASVMDGFAVDSAATTTGTTLVASGGQHFTHAIRDKVFAGDAPGERRWSTTEDEQPKEENTLFNLPVAYYVTTGAVIPAGLDCVVPIEDVTVSDDQTLVKIPADKMVANKWIRAPGCDIPAGTTVLAAGTLIDSIALGLLQQSGALTVKVRKQISVGVLSTGNELLTNLNTSMSADQPEDWWEDMQEGSIPDVNRPILLSLLALLPNVNVIDLGMTSDDDVDDMVERIRQGCTSCDVILTTGGISMGETDIVEHVLLERLNGTLHFGRLNMKPGKPTTFVTVESSDDNKKVFVFALPGNPVSAVVCTHPLVTPCLQLLTDGPDTTADTHGASVKDQVERMVENAYVHAEVAATLSQDLKLDFERPEYHRVTVDTSNGLPASIQSTGVQRSSRLMSLRDAEGLLVLPQATTDHPVAKAGETYTVLILNPKNRQDRVQVCRSEHLVLPKERKPLKIALVRVLPDELMVVALPMPEDLPLRVETALSGSKSGLAEVISSRVYTGEIEDFCKSLLLNEEEGSADILVVVCPKYHGSLLPHSELAKLLRSELSKVADTLALQARRGVAAQDPTAALFDVVVGFRPSQEEGKEGVMVVLLPEEGLDGGLGNVRGLLKHGLATARGGVHKHS